MLISFVIFHIFATLLCFYRENYEVKIGVFGQIMRFVEIIGVMCYIALVSTSFTNYGIYLMFDHVEIGSTIKSKLFNNVDIPVCITDQGINISVTNNSIHWLFIEILVALVYLFTMMLLMLKSRYTLIGIDQSG